MSIRFRLLTEADVRTVISMGDLIDSMAAALKAFSAGRVVQPVRPVIPISAGGAHASQDQAFFATMPAYATDSASLGAKLVTVFGSNAARGLPTHLASIVLLDAETGALRALLDGRYITEARTAAVSAVSSRLLARPGASSLAIIGSGVQARSHFEALTHVHAIRSATVFSPTPARRQRFAEEMSARAADHHGGKLPGLSSPVRAADHPGEAVVGADLIVIATSSSTPVIESGWVKPGAHIMAIGAYRPTMREIDPTLTARARLFVDSREAALVEAGDIVMGIKEGRFGPDHIVAELGEILGGATGRRDNREITIFKSLGLAVEDVTAADLAYRRAVERGVGTELAL